MNDLEAGTFVMMVKNDDGSFSPVGLAVASRVAAIFIFIVK